MSETHANQALLVAIGLDERQLVLGAIGEQAKAHVANMKPIDLLDLGFYEDDLPATEPGIYVWEGTFAIAHYSDDDSECEWDGTWRAARLDDFPKFGLTTPALATFNT